MRVILGFGPMDVRVVQRPRPVPGEGEVLVAVRACGICGSDKGYWLRGLNDHIPGHEAAGEIAGLGPGVHRLRMGDRVAVHNVIGCGRCPACRSGSFCACPRRPAVDSVSSGYGEYLVAPERNCLVLDDRISFEAGCLIFDNWGTPYAALERAEVGAGDDVLVSGCGPIGLAAVVLAKERGAFVIAVDPLEYRRQAALRAGADAALSPDGDVAGAAHELTGGTGVRVVVECSGHGPAYLSGLAALRFGGTFVSVGEHAQVELKPSDLLIRNHLDIKGSWYSTLAEGRAVQRMMLERRIDPLWFVTHRVTLPEVPEAMARVCRSEDGVVKTLIVMPERVS